MVFELKRGTLTREAVVPAIDNASWLDSLDCFILGTCIVEHSGRRGIDKIENFETWYDDPDNVEGTISRIGDAATSQFSVLPRLNDSSTFTTVTQRIKVPVDIKRGHGRLQPGMMVEIYVDDGTAEGFWSWLP